MRKAKTQVSSRDFQQKFSQVAESLKPGESVTVTKHGAAIGTFTKAPKPLPPPDYLGNLQKLGYSIQDGQKVIDAVCDLS